MTKTGLKLPRNFWGLVGLILGIDVVLVLLYTLIFTDLTARLLSDALCTSALLLGAATALPVLLDAGRGLGVGFKVAQDQKKEARNAALQVEQLRRQQGMRYSFALALAAFIVALLSLFVAVVL